MATDWLKLKTDYLNTPVSLRALAVQNGLNPWALQKVAAREGWAAAKRNQSLPVQPEQSETAQPAQEGYPANPAPQGDAEMRVLKGDAATCELQGDAEMRGPQGDASKPAPQGDAANPAPQNGATNPTQATEAPTPAREQQPVKQTPATTPPPAPQEASERRAKLMAIGDQLTDQLARAAVELDKQVLKHKRKTREMVYDDAQAKGKPVEETVEENYELEIVDATVSCAGLQKLSAALKNLCDVTAAGDGDGQSVGMVAQLMKKLDEEAGREGGADALHDPQTM